MKQDLRNRAENFSPAKWWDEKQESITEIANANVKSAVAVKAAPLYNPYEGQLCGRQLGESVEYFLERLPPSITHTTTSMTARAGGIPWIYIANPYRKSPKNDSGELANEGPPDENSDWPQFVVRGGDILEELTSIKNDIEKKKTGQARAAITRAINIERDVIVQKLLDTAVQLHCTSGKVYPACPF